MNGVTLICIYISLEDSVIYELTFANPRPHSTGSKNTQICFCFKKDDPITEIQRYRKVAIFCNPALSSCHPAAFFSLNAPNELFITC